MSEKQDGSEQDLQGELEEEGNGDQVICVYPSEYYKISEHFPFLAVISIDRNRRGPYVLLPGSVANSYWI